MRVIYKKELILTNNRGAAFTLDKAYELKQSSQSIDDAEYFLEDDNGFNHYFTVGCLFEHFRVEKSAKRMTVSVAHCIVALDSELGCLIADLDNLKAKIEERDASLKELLKEYNVEDI